MANCKLKNIYVAEFIYFAQNNKKENFDEVEKLAISKFKYFNFQYFFRSLATLNNYSKTMQSQKLYVKVKLKIKRLFSDPSHAKTRQWFTHLLKA